MHLTHRGLDSPLEARIPDLLPHAARLLTRLQHLRWSASGIVCVETVLWHRDGHVIHNAVAQEYDFFSSDPLFESSGTWHAVVSTKNRDIDFSDHCVAAVQ